MRCTQKCATFFCHRMCKTKPVRRVLRKWGRSEHVEGGQGRGRGCQWEWVVGLTDSGSNCVWGWSTTTAATSTASNNAKDTHRSTHTHTHTHRQWTHHCCHIYAQEAFVMPPGDTYTHTCCPQTLVSTTLLPLLLLSLLALHSTSFTRSSALASSSLYTTQVNPSSPAGQAKSRANLTTNLAIL